MNRPPESTLDIIKYLKLKDINPILYGSQGVSLYLGAFKKFNDIDLLVGDDWINSKWPNLINIMSRKGFKLIDEHEHEFRNVDTTVNFASEAILTRDGITESIEEIIVIKKINDLELRTLTLQAFRRAYDYSAKDGYRNQKRGKKDQETIALIDRMSKTLRFHPDD
jgi:hypothetical protein